MLSLLLALLVTPPNKDPQIASILNICDTPKATRSCAAYIHGFADAMVAQEQVATVTAQRLGVHFPSFACFRGPLDIERVRARIVSTLKTPSPEPARNQILIVLSEMYPCQP